MTFPKRYLASKSIHGAYQMGGKFRNVYPSGSYEKHFFN
jgi:hypothetical protein